MPGNSGSRDKDGAKNRGIAENQFKIHPLHYLKAGGVFYEKDRTEGQWAGWHQMQLRMGI